MGYLYRLLGPSRLRQLPVRFDSLDFFGCTARTHSQMLRFFNRSSTVNVVAHWFRLRRVWIRGHTVFFCARERICGMIQDIYEYSSRGRYRPQVFVRFT